MFEDFLCRQEIDKQLYFIYLYAFCASYNSSVKLNKAEAIVI